MIDLKPAIDEHKKKVNKLTLNINELSEALGISKNKARQLTHAKGFPVIVLGRQRLTITSQLEKWVQDNIGLVI